MSNTVVLGAQWGDEGKGKVVDYLAEEADLVVRFNGGNNAGHTVVVGDQTYKFHIMPSSAIRGKRGVLGNGVVIDPRVLVEEIEKMEAAGHPVKLAISHQAHVIMPYHTWLDGRREDSGKGVGSTRRGIGPTYSDKMDRKTAIRMEDLVGPDFKAKLVAVLSLKKNRLADFLGEKTVEQAADEIYRTYQPPAGQLAPMVKNTPLLVNQALDDGNQVLFEGAQGALLDVDHGSYPYVTSSSVTAGGVCTGAGVAPSRVGEVIGVAKAYVTRVGLGPFPTLIEGQQEEAIRQKGHEFGATTGRPRKCGWMDLPALKYTTMLNGFDSLALTKADVLSGLDEVPVCVAYRVNGGEVEGPYPPTEACKPVYERLPGWEDMSLEEWAELASEGYLALPENLRSYIEFIEEMVGVPVSMVSVGPSRKATLVRE